MKKSMKKLRLARETLLKIENLAEANGGFVKADSDPCADTQTCQGSVCLVPSCLCP